MRMAGIFAQNNHAVQVSLPSYSQDKDPLNIARNNSCFDGANQ